MATPQLTTPGDVDQEIIECWRLLLKAEEAGRHLTVDEHGEYNEAWVDAADALLAAGIVVSARARVLPLWSPEMDRPADMDAWPRCVRSSFRYRTVALRDRGRCQPTVESLPNDRSALRHVLACLGLGFPAKSVPEQANRDCTSPVTESC